MADVFNTKDNLYWVFTNYAKERLADFAAGDKVFLYKLKIGSYNWYEDENKKLGKEGYSEAAFKAYFQGDEEINDLGNFIRKENTDGDFAPMEFFITGKNLDERKECVILTTTIDETFCGFDIREVGIYETIGNQDHLFAVCTMQPLPRPSTETNHYIASELNCHLYSQKLVNIFDNIEIDKTNSYVTKPELQEYQSNLLFVEANLAEQISRNSQLIGYNRIEQLHDLIKENQANYAKFGAASVYSTLASLVDVKNFWVFDYSGIVTRKTMLKDISLYHENLGTDQLSTRYEKEYEGVASWLNFDKTHYYTLGMPSDITTKLVNGVTQYYVPNRDNLTFVDLQKDEEGKIVSVTDSPFTIIFVGSQNDNGSDKTILAKYNTFAEHPGILVTVTKKRQVVVSLYSNRVSYITFTTPVDSVPKAGEFYSLIIGYNGNVDEPRVTVNINEKQVNTTFTKSGQVYSGMSLLGMLLPMYSFVRTDSGDTNHINSKVCLLSLAKGDLSSVSKQSISYSLMSLVGVNPCLV